MQKYTLESLQSNVPIVPPRLIHSYKQYLNSKDWKLKRNKIIRRDGFRCSVCGSSENLVVHHLNYEHIFREKLSELCTLCKMHHDLLHRGNVDCEKEDIAGVA